MIDLQKLQQEIYQNKVNRGFNVTEPAGCKFSKQSAVSRRQELLTYDRRLPTADV